MDPAKYEYQSEFARQYFSQGKAEGRADILIRQLDLRFGPLPAEVEAQIRAAAIEVLEDIAVRVLTAQTLAEALAAK